jgi:hypothetical protein
MQGIAVFNYCNGDSNQELFGLINGDIVTAAVTFDNYYNQAFGSDPNFTAIYQVFINIWISRMANHYRNYAVARLVTLASPWKTIAGNNPTAAQLLVANAQLALIKALTDQVVGIYFNTAPFN